MADTNQYLRLTIGNTYYLLPSSIRYSIEPRDGLTANDSSTSPVAAWRVFRNGRWPAYALDANLRPARPPADWQRALYLESSPGHTIGLIVSDAHLLSRGEVQAVVFTPPGPPPTPAGHLFTHAWVNENRVTLVIEPRTLIAYLNGLGV